MRNIFIVVAVLILFIIVGYAVKQNNSEETAQNMNATNTPSANNTGGNEQTSPVIVTPISHATLVLTWGDTIFYIDPTGEAKAFNNQPKPTITLVTDIHGDHLSTSTLNAVLGSSTLIVPQAVKDQLPKNLADRAQVLSNNRMMIEKGFSIVAVPMYNLPEIADSRHTKGRGNGYVIEKDGYRVYIAGDTDNTTEMQALTDIDMAFIPMNQPYTMTIQEAADAVLAFKPRHVYPYHYRGQNGLSDVDGFKKLVNAKDPNIDVVLLDWYPDQE